MNKDWDNYFNREYTAADITPEAVILVFETYGMACGPVSFTFIHLLKDIGELPLFHDALAAVSESTDEMTLTITIETFLAENNTALLDDFNQNNEQQLPTDFVFKLPGDEELIAAAVNAHNLLQF